MRVFINISTVIKFSKKHTIPTVFKHKLGTLINTQRFNQWTKILSTTVQVVKFLKLITSKNRKLLGMNNKFNEQKSISDIQLAKILLFPVKRKNKAYP